MSHIIEPLLIFHEFRKFHIIREYGVTANSLHWREPGIAPTLFVLDALKKLNSEELKNYFQNYKQNLIDFMLSNFDESVGGFRQNAETSPTIYATYLALNIINIFYDGDYNKDYFKPLGYKKACEVLGADRVGKIDNFIKQSQDPETGGFLEAPGVGYQMTVPRTNAAYLALRHLDAELPNKAKLVKFLTSICLKQDTNNGIGFSAIPNGEPLSCSTWFALKMLESLDQKDWIIENKSKLIAFLKSCWSENNMVGGFSGQPGGFPSIAHTCLVISCFYEIFNLKSTEIGDPIDPIKIFSLVKTCQSIGGFSFIEKIAPEAYSTRNAIKLINLLAPNFTIEDKFDKNKIERFLIHSLFDKDIKVFRGYMNYEKTRFFKRYRKITDAILMPKDPFRKGQITPIPYFIGLFASSPFIIGCFILYHLFGNIAALYAGLGFASLGLTTIAGSIQWFMKR